MRLECIVFSIPPERWMKKHKSYKGEEKKTLDPYEVLGFNVPGHGKAR